MMFPWLVRRIMFLLCSGLWVYVCSVDMAVESPGTLKMGGVVYQVYR